ncbi:MAG: Hsp20/alpha crystallin family protein [Chloroflexi bacterium]|nr:Hsp20/alpha crystallin family protein [Chloroflexota bacterium]
MAIEVWRPRTVTPFRLLDEMEQEMEQMMSPSMISPLRRLWRRWPGDGMALAPDIDLYDREDKFLMRMDLPGVKKEDIDISMVGDTITVKGERKRETEIKDEEYRRSEVCYGAFSRSVTLPGSVDASKIEANLREGVLEVVMPKTEAAKPSKIQIKAK